MRPAEWVAARLALVLRLRFASETYEAVDHHVFHSVRRFLVRRHKVPTHGTRRFTYTAAYGVLGVLRLNPRRYDAAPWA